MAAPTLNKFKVTEFNGNNRDFLNKLVDERAFYSVYPNVMNYEMLDPAMRKMSSNNFPTISDGKTLVDVFEKQAKIKDVYQDFIRWRLYMDGNDLRSDLMSFPTNAENGCIGVNGSIFEMGLSSDVYGPGDMIILEGLSEIPLIIKSHPSPHGVEFIYEFAILDGTGYIDASWLRAGLQVKANLGALRGEAAVERGNVHWTSGNSFIEFEVPMSSFGWEMKITDKAWLASKHFRISPCTKELSMLTDGKDIITNEMDMKFKQVTNKHIDNYLAWGRSGGRYASAHLDHITEKPMSHGPGFFQFAESANYLEYNLHQNIVEFFRNYIPATWNDHVKPEDQVLDIWTGRGGLTLVQKAGEELDRKGGGLRMASDNYTDTTGYFKGQKGKGLGALTYTEFYLQPFGKIRFHHMALLDSTTMDTRKYNNLPYTSYEFLIFNDGRGDARNENVYIMRNPDASQYLYSTGLMTPTGYAGKNGNALKYHNGLGTENAYKIIRDENIGMVVKDPGYMTWVRPAFA